MLFFIFIFVVMVVGLQRYGDIWWKYDGDRDIWILANNSIFEIASVSYFSGDMLITDCIDIFKKLLSEGKY